MDALLTKESLARVESELGQLGVRAICWESDGSFSVDGRPVEAASVQPEVGWISFDVFMHKQMAGYIDALCQFDSLRWVQTGNAGLDNPLYDPLVARGVRISKSWAQSIPIAEYVVGYALHHLHDMAARVADSQAGKWAPASFRELYGSRWLIIGFGHIGHRVSIRARAFECHVTALRRSTTPTDDVDAIIEHKDLHATLAQSDVVVLACPQTSETTGLVDDAFVDAMKKGSLLINIARGGLIEDRALLRGLSRDTPEAAVLDVFHEEPLPADDPYWRHPQVIVTAHMSNAGTGTVGRGVTQFLDNLRAYVSGDPVSDEVDPASLKT